MRSIFLIVCLVVTVAAAQEVDPRNLVPNGSFEDLDDKGWPSGWTFSQGADPNENTAVPEGLTWAIDREVRHDKWNALRLSGHRVAEDFAGFHLREPIHLKASRVYELSMWIKARDVKFSSWSPDPRGVVFQCAATAGGQGVPPLILHVDNGTYGWKRFSTIYETFAATTLTPRTWRAVLEGTYWVDDVSLREIRPEDKPAAEPASTDAAVTFPAVPVPELISHYPDALRSEAGEFALLFAPPTKKILRAMTPDKNVLSGETAGAVSLAGNEHEGIQIVMVPLWDKAETRDVQVWVEPLINKKAGEFVMDSEVTARPVGYWGLQEDNKLIGTPWPDILLPSAVADRADFSARGQELQPIWVDVSVSRDTPPGDYETTVRIMTQGHSVVARIDVHVYDFAIPTAHSLHFTMTGCQPGSRELLPKYRIALRRIMDPGPPFDLYGVIKDHEFREFAEVKPMIEAALQKFHASGGTRFMIPIPHFKGDKGTLIPVGGGWSRDTQFVGEDSAYIIRYHREIAQWLRQKGLLEDAFVVIWDEPAPIARVLKQIHTIRELIREADPEIRCLINAGLHRKLMGECDIWDTGMWQWHKDRDLVPEITDRGIELWWYNTPNMQCNPETDLLATRLLFWSMWKYGITGGLHWSGDIYRYHGVFGTLVRLANTTDCWWSKGPGEFMGGGTFTYPLPGMSLADQMKLGSAALPSIRLEAIRDGLEDYEYFVLLRELVGKARVGGKDVKMMLAAEKLLAVPIAIESADFAPEKLTQYTRDDSLVRAHRDRIARMIEQLSERD